MPAEQGKTWSIACDNPDCPGHPELAPDDPTGWLMVTHELYAEGTTQTAVYGDVSCVAAHTTTKAQAGEAW